MVFVPAVSFDGIDGAADKITVKGPGQNCFATEWNKGFGSVTDSAMASEFTSNRIGFDSARPLISKMRSTAASLNGSPPRPYAVSVG